MTENVAAGPKTGDLVGVSSRMQQAIEDQIAALAEGVVDCIRFVRKTVPDADNPHANTRANERRDAVLIVEATGELLQSIAKLKGEFRQSYHVTRVNGDNAAPQPKWPAPDGYNTRTYPYLSEEQIDALTVKEYNAYLDMRDALPSLRNMDKSKTAQPAKSDELAQLEKDVDRLAKMMERETPSPSQMRGSNGGSGNS